MKFFNIIGGLRGDTPDRMKELTAQGATDSIYTFSAVEAVARDAAACLIDEAGDYLIGGTLANKAQQPVENPYTGPNYHL
ncbi:MAG: hypothetical protein H6867_10310 [Rhodospirillales bacterium]|nr:hypothetical protein [Rhodospirillales bacterium]MCB9995823.1 hypothetical protein [Rhodospirillales bacterium]